MTGGDDSAVSVEATGETVGEAKWMALRELERRIPGLEKASVRFQIVSQGERGLLGVGYTPARVVASVDEAAAPTLLASAEPVDETEAAAAARELVARIVEGIGVRVRIDVEETDGELRVSCTGGDLGLLIGKHGQTIDAIQYLVNTILWRARPDAHKPVTVDAAGYQSRRRAALEALAVRTAQRALANGEAVELEPMTSTERKIVHLRLKDFAGVETRSEGAEPHRFVVVAPRDA